MNTASTLQDAEGMRLLTEIGFLAAARGDAKRAEKLFSSLKLLRPDKAFPDVGTAVALMNAGRAGDAATRLANVHVEDTADMDLIRALHGLALQLDGRTHQSQSVLRQVAARASATTPGGDGVKLAQALLGDAAAAAPAPNED